MVCCKRAVLSLYIRLSWKVLSRLKSFYNEKATFLLNVMSLNISIEAKL